MKKLLYSSTIILSFIIPTTSFANESGYTMPDVDFNQFVCSYLESQPTKEKALAEILAQIGSIMSEQQKNTLLEIKNSETAAASLCADITN